MKRNKASLNDDGHSNNDSDDDNAKKPKNEVSEYEMRMMKLRGH